jgi:hypothetical protein
MMADFTNEQVVAGIRRYWQSVPGGRGLDVYLADGVPYSVPGGKDEPSRLVTPRVVVSNLRQNGGMPPGVHASDVPPLRSR